MFRALECKFPGDGIKKCSFILSSVDEVERKLYSFCNLSDKVVDRSCKNTILSHEQTNKIFNNLDDKQKLKVLFYLIKG
jgi:hypothetical protein